MKADSCATKKLTSEYANLAKFLRTIGDENRLRILCLLEEGEKCVCEIYPNLDMAQNLVSSHLKILLDLDLINLRGDWKRNYYSINTKTFKKYKLSLINFLKKYE